MKKLYICNRFLGKNWGLKPKITSWAYSSIVRPSALHGSLTWANSLLKKTYKAKLLRIDNKALKLISRTFNSTPSYVLYTLLNIAPLDYKVLESAILTLYRLSASSDFTYSDHLKPVQNLITEFNLPNPGNLDIMPTSTNFHRSYSILIDHDIFDNFNSPSLYELTPPTTFNIFTDGSKSPSHTSASFIIYNNLSKSTTCKILLHTHNSIFQAEASAILHALEHIKNKCVTEFITSAINLNIHCDSQAVLNSLNSPSTNSFTIFKCKSILEYFKFCTVKFYWIPGHKGYRGNEEADFIARTPPADLHDIPDILYITSFIDPPLSYVKQKLKITRKIFLKRHINSADSTNLLKKYTHLISNDKLLSKLSKYYSSTNIRILAQCVSGIAPLNYFLSKFVTTINPTCSFCQLEYETNYHFLCICPRFSEIRMEHLGHRILNLKTLYSNSISQLLKYIIETNRF